MRTFINQDKDDWSSWLPYFSYTYNSTIHSATKYAPFELVFGKNNDIPQNIYRDRLTPIYNEEDYARELKNRLKIAHEDAKNNQIINKVKRKTFYDRTLETRISNIQSGDFVLIKDETNGKLNAIYKGPYEVIEVENENCIILKNEKKIKVHLNNIKKYYNMLTFWVNNYQ